MIVGLLSALLSVSLISDWIKRRDVNYVEGELIENKRWIQWGTCWPARHGRPDYNNPRCTFRYAMVRLPSWTYEQVPWRDEMAWCQRVLFRFGPGPWTLMHWPEESK